MTIMPDKPGWWFGRRPWEREWRCLKLSLNNQDNSLRVIDGVAHRMPFAFVWAGPVTLPAPPGATEVVATIDQMNGERARP